MLKHFNCRSANIKFFPVNVKLLLHFSNWKYFKVNKRYLILFQFYLWLMTVCDSQRVNYKVTKKPFLIWILKINFETCKINTPVERKILKRSEDIKRHNVSRDGESSNRISSLGAYKGAVKD